MRDSLAHDPVNKSFKMGTEIRIFLKKFREALNTNYVHKKVSFLKAHWRAFNLTSKNVNKFFGSDKKLN